MIKVHLAYHSPALADLSSWSLPKLVCSEFRDCGEEHDDAEDETVVQEDEPKATDDAEDISVRDARACATEDVAV